MPTPLHHPRLLPQDASEAAATTTTTMEAIFACLVTATTPDDGDTTACALFNCLATVLETLDAESRQTYGQMMIMALGVISGGAVIVSGRDATPGVMH